MCVLTDNMLGCFKGRPTCLCVSTCICGVVGYTSTCVKVEPLILRDVFTCFAVECLCLCACPLVQ